MTRKEQHAAGQSLKKRQNLGHIEQKKIPDRQVKTKPDTE